MKCVGSSLLARVSSGRAAAPGRRSEGRRFVAFLLFALVAPLPPGSPGEAQEPEGWIATYDGGTGGGFERPVGVAVDAEGAIYVSGVTGRGAATVKYDAEGELLWSVEDRGHDVTAMALDSAGNLLVGGRGGRGSEIVRYDPEGNATLFAEVEGLLLAMDLDARDRLLVVTARGTDIGLQATLFDPRAGEEWSEIYPFASTGWRDSLFVGFDAEGSAHLAVTDRGGPTTEYLVVKHDSRGEALWSNRQPPVHESFRLAGLVLDPGGSSIVGGHVTACDEVRFSAGYALVKYDSGGNELWSACHTPVLQSAVEASAVGGDAEGNVFITGSSCGLSCVTATVKYSPDGELLWEAWLPDARPAAMAIDSNGWVVVAGTEELCEGQECRSAFVTVKYDPQGREAWIRRLDAPGDGESSPVALTLDSAGRVYVTGTASKDYGLVKYDVEGNEAWRAFFDTPAERTDAPIGIEVDQDGGAYVAGTSSDLERSDWATVKYDRAGSVLWEDFLENARAKAMASDETGGVIVTGRGFGPDRVSVTVKYAPDGRRLWEARAADVEPTSIGVDSEGSVHIAGGRGRVVVKYDSDGTELWSSRSEQTLLNLKVDPSGYVYLAEESEQEGASLVVLDFDGIETWRSSVGEPGGYRLQDLAVDSGGNVYAIGVWQPCDPSCRVVQVLARYSRDGDLEWTIEVPIWTIRASKAAVTVNPVDDAIVSFGSCGRVVNVCEVVTARYGPDGTLKWIRSREGVDLDFSSEPKIAIDSTGAFYVHGIATTTVKYDSAGDELWAMDLPGAGPTYMALGRENVQFAGRHRADYLILQESSEAFLIERTGGLSVSVRAPELSTPVEAGETTYTWTFGDGVEATGSSASHAYERPGSFEIQLVSSNRLLWTRKSRRVDIEPPFLRGDPNADGEVNLSDGTVILGSLFGGRGDLVRCEKGGDTNDSGTLEISDAVYLLAHLFQAGAPPTEPFGTCGIDPTADSLTCLSYGACE